MTEAEDLTINADVQCRQYADGDILLMANGRSSWLTHPSEVEQLVSWLLRAYRYMLKQWVEEDDTVTLHPGDIVFNSEEDEKAYYEWLGAERKEE